MIFLDVTKLFKETEAFVWVYDKEFVLRILRFWFDANLVIHAVTLSKTKKRGKEQKESLVTLVRGCLDEYSALYVFSFENMRNSLFKEFRDKLKTSSR